jgi:hypothetical protein
MGSTSETDLHKQIRVIELGLAGLLYEAEQGSMVNAEDLRLLHELAVQAITGE